MTPWIRLALVISCTLALAGLVASGASADEKRREALALEVMELTGASNIGGQVAYGLLAQLKPMFPTVPDELWSELAASFESNEIVTLSVPIYVKHFDEADLEGLVEFYKSPLGRKVIQKMPLVMQESMVVGNEYGQRKGAEIIERLQAEGHQPQGL